MFISIKICMSVVFLVMLSGVIHNDEDTHNLQNDSMKFPISILKQNKLLAHPYHY